MPFLESLTCLAYLAGGTEQIALGMSVLRRGDSGI
jgi:hypothetical protein